MSEIERAIKVLEEEYAFSLECDATQKRSSAYKTALTALRAELSRQENAPLTGGLQTIYYTPYSCEYCGDHIAVGWAFCPECGTPTKQKRYEPKGEKE